MAKTDFRSVDEYLATQPPAVRAVLERVRGAIRRALPEAEEAISYQIPAYKVEGAVALYFAGWKEHVSLYPVSGEMIAAFGDELAPYVASKGTLRFPLSSPVPLRLIGRIAKVRAAETAERQRAKKTKAAPSKRVTKSGSKPAAKRAAASPSRRRR
jgi:uncharacterized protein YdhG (YjbR/CyaY superfamily)